MLAGALTTRVDSIDATRKTVSTSAAAQITVIEPSHFKSSGSKLHVLLVGLQIAGAVQLSLEVHLPVQCEKTFVQLPAAQKSSTADNIIASVCGTRDL